MDDSKTPGENQAQKLSGKKQNKTFQRDNAAFVSDENPREEMEMKKGTASFKRKTAAVDERQSVPRKSQESTDSYNPFEHREVAKPTTDFGSLAHMLKTSLGSGILAMPMAFRNAGLVLGMVGTILLGVICTHCIQMLVRSSQVLCKRLRVPTLSFSRTAEVAFETGPPKMRKLAKTAKIVITTELLLSFILGNTVYVIFIAQSIYQAAMSISPLAIVLILITGMLILTSLIAGCSACALSVHTVYFRIFQAFSGQTFTSYEAHVADFYSKPGIDVRLYILMLWIPLTLMCFFKNLKSLVPFSIIANLFVVVSFGITLYYIFREIHPPESVHMVAPFPRLPLFLTTVIFAIEGIGTVLTIENEMQHPEHFIGGRCGIAYISMTIVVSLYSIIGFFGYLEYGEDTKGSITLNLPIGDVMAQVVKILIATAIFFTYALQFYVPINIILDMIKEKTPPKHHTYYSYAVRVGLVTLTIIMSIAVPKLEPIISLVGAICFSMLGLLLPAMIDTVTRWPDFGRCRWRLHKNIVIIIISLIALMSGTYASLINIIETYDLNH